MELKELAAYAGMEVPETWENCAPAALAQYRPDWLDGLDFDAILDFYDLGGEYQTRLEQELALLDRDETLRKICWIMHYCLFYTVADDFRTVWRWGKCSPTRSVGGHGTPTTCVVALLAGQPLHAKQMRERGYDAEQIAFQKRGVRDCWIGERAKGIDGIRFSQMIWGAYFIRGNLVRFGRLEYEMGLIPTNPQLAELLGQDIKMAYIHIPGGSSLADDGVQASLDAARTALVRYFPEATPDKLVFYTHTWLLSPQLREFLPETSNIIKFQNRFKLFKTEDSPASFVGFVFGGTRPFGTYDLSELPEDTTMRREIKRRLIAGTPLEIGSGYVPPEK